MNIDFNRIDPRHAAIDERLVQWAKWVRVHPKCWPTQPMFKNYRAPKQWESDLRISTPPSPLEALETERAVSTLPAKHRTAIRWSYAFGAIPVNKVCHALAVSKPGLAELLSAGRDMVANKLKQG